MAASDPASPGSRSARSAIATSRAAEVRATSSERVSVVRSPRARKASLSSANWVLDSQRTTMSPSPTGPTRAIDAVDGRTERVHGLVRAVRRDRATARDDREPLGADPDRQRHGRVPSASTSRRVWCPGAALPPGRRSARSRRGAPLEQPVQRLQQHAVGAVVLRGGSRRRGPVPRFRAADGLRVEVGLDVGAAEAVDGLLRVADNDERVARRAEEDPLEDPPLVGSVSWNSSMSPTGNRRRSARRTGASSSVAIAAAKSASRSA